MHFSFGVILGGEAVEERSAGGVAESVSAGHLVRHIQPWSISWRGTQGTDGVWENSAPSKLS